MNFEFTPQQRELIQKTKDFCAKECPPSFESSLEKSGEFPHELYRKMADSGFFRIPFSKQYGGSDGNIFDVVLLTEEFAKNSYTATNMYLVPIVFAGMMVAINGSEKQKSEMIPKLSKGELKFSFALTEPEVGSDAKAVKTSATVSGDKLIVNGTKYWTTGATVADYIISVIVTKPGEDARSGISAVLVPGDSQGLKITPIPKLAGNAFPSCKVDFENVEVPVENVLGGKELLNQGWGQLAQTADLEKICVAASCVGAAEAVLKECADFAKGRQQFGQPIIKFQSIQHSLVDMATEIEAMRWMTYQAAWAKAQGNFAFKEICMAKLFCSETLSSIVKRGMQIFGGRGYSMEYNMQRYLRESYLSLYAGGTSEIQKNIIARFL